MGHLQFHAVKGDVAVGILTLLSLGKPCPVFHSDGSHAGEWGLVKKTKNETLSKNNLQVISPEILSQRAWQFLKVYLASFL